MTENYYIKMKSPVGELTLIADAKNLLAVLWPKEKAGRTKITLGTRDNGTSPATAILQKTEKQLHEYFAGNRKKFDLPLKFTGTDFQNKVWNGLCKITYGKTASYVELATGVGSPKAVRAAGTANGRNPLSIVVPCHRVIGKNGSLTGFAGGLKTKAFLLELES